MAALKSLQAFTVTYVVGLASALSLMPKMNKEVVTMRALKTEYKEGLQTKTMSSSIFPTDPIPCRDDMAKVAEQHFKKTGKAAEIGVYQGNFAAKNLRNWKGMYYMIDAWAFRPGDSADKNYEDDAVNRFNMETAENHTAFAGDRRVLMQSLSTDAAQQFEDNSLDWVYIDALHTRDAMTADLEAWYKKVRPGGLVTGDDYGDKDDTELMTAERWATKYGGVAKMESNQWAVIGVLSNFTRAHNLELHITWMNDCYMYNAWYFVKPEH